MNKKIVSMLVAVLLIASLIGCGGSSKKSDDGLGDFPNKPITVIIPWAAGGAYDMIGRTLQDIIKKEKNIDIAVKNVEGGASVAGVTECMTSSPDGYTLVLHGAGYLAMVAAGAAENIIGKATYLSTVHNDIQGIFVKVGGAYPTLESFIAAAKANPGKISLGHPGTLNMNQACIIEFSKALGDATGTLLLSMPYSGGSRAVTEVMGGHIDGALIKFSDCINQLDNNEMKGLVVFARKRAVSFPDVPTAEELGYDAFPYGDPLYTGSYMVGPQGVKPAIQEYLANLFKAAIETPRFQELAKKCGFQSVNIATEAAAEKEASETLQAMRDMTKIFPGDKK